MEKTESTSTSISKPLLESLKRYKTHMHFHSIDELIEDLLFFKLGTWLMNVQIAQKEKDTETLQATSKWLKEQITIMFNRNPKRIKANAEAELETLTRLSQP